jgi:hypothetical protein
VIVANLSDGDVDVVLRYGAHEAALHGCGLRLVRSYLGGRRRPGRTTLDDADARAEAAEIVRHALARAGAILDPGLDVTGVVVRGPAVESVLDTAGDAQGVVVQRRDVLQLVQALTRSTATGTIPPVHVPVVCVPPDWTRGTPGRRPITVGVESPEHSQALLHRAVTIAREHAAPLRVLHTWSLPAPYDEQVLRRVGPEWEASIRREIESALDRPESERPSTPLDVDVRHGDPLDALLSAARDSEMLILGRHDHARVPAGCHLGRVARGALHESCCPVALLPTAPRRSAPDEDRAAARSDALRTR